MSEQINTPSLRMAWSPAPWDEVVCGFPVLQITSMKIQGKNADSDMQVFEEARDRLGAGLVSCRLPHACMEESMLLEDHGFRFIEMVHQPEIELKNFSGDPKDPQVKIAPAHEIDLPILRDIAGTAFHHERFQMDPRLDPAIGALRYQNWVSSSFHHPTQHLFALFNGEQHIGFFVTELLNDSTCYWHLNAIAPISQGSGLGRRAWIGMLNQAATTGAQRVRTTIAARNQRILNLYASLGFCFAPPSMTFHWTRPERSHESHGYL